MILIFPTYYLFNCSGNIEILNVNNLVKSLRQKKSLERTLPAVDYWPWKATWWTHETSTRIVDTWCKVSGGLWCLLYNLGHLCICRSLSVGFVGPTCPKIHRMPNYPILRKKKLRISSLYDKINENILTIIVHILFSALIRSTIQNTDFVPIVNLKRQNCSKKFEFFDIYIKPKRGLPPAHPV